MINNWLKSEEKRGDRVRALLRSAARREDDAEELLSSARKAREDAAALTTEALPPLGLVECCAYLWDCSVREVAPTYHDACIQGFRVHAAALQSVINDAVTLRMVTPMGEGRILCHKDTPVHTLMLKRQNSK